MDFSKKHFISTVLTIILFFFLLTSPTLLAWDNCPFGIINDEYPGDCGRYIDTNSDGICDQSQPNPATSQNQEIENNETSTTEEQHLSAETITEKSILTNKNIITLIASFFITISLIIITKILTKKQMLSTMKEKILWNILLLVFFMPSAITGILLTLMVDFPILREISINFIELHSYTSFFFMWISGYHILWHTTYYMKGMKKLFKK